MSSDDIAEALILGCIAGLLVFVAMVLAKRGKSVWSAPKTPVAVPARDTRHSSPSPPTPSERGGFRPLAALLALDRAYVFGARVVLVAMLLYGAWVAPRLRWVGLGALVTFGAFSLVWHYV